MNRMAGMFIAMALVAVLVIPCSADILVRTDGTILEGKVQSQTEEAVNFLIPKYGNVVVTIARKDIREIRKGPINVTTRPAPVRPVEKLEGPAYYVLSLTGEIGVEIKAEFLARALRMYRHKPKIVILHINSPGGDVAEAGRIAALLAETKDVRFVALVEKAHSTAAAVAMACPEICMMPAGTLGNVIPYLTDAEGKVTTAPAAFTAEAKAALRVAARALALHAIPIRLSGAALRVFPRHEDTGCYGASRTRSGRPLRRSGLACCIAGADRPALLYRGRNPVVHRWLTASSGEVHP